MGVVARSRDTGRLRQDLVRPTRYDLPGGAMEACALRSFLEPCLLLLLREYPDHGYSLIGRLKALGVTNGDPGRVYRALRSLEQGDLVRSEWTPSASGPARRIYHVTVEGCATLGAWVRVAEEARDLLDECLARCAGLREAAGAGGTACERPSESAPARRAAGAREEAG